METNLDTNMLIEAYEAFKALETVGIVELTSEVMTENIIELMPVVAVICAIYIVFNLYFLFEKFRIRD